MQTNIVFLFMFCQLENCYQGEKRSTMASFRIKLLSPRLIRSTKFLIILFFGLIIFFTNLYFLKLSKPTETETPTTNWENKEEKDGTSQLIVKTTSTIQKNNSTTTTISPKTVASRLTLSVSSSENQNRGCAHRVSVLAGATVLLKDIMIRPKLGRARVLEVQLDHPSEEDEFFKLQKGFFTLYCDGDENKVQEKLNEARKFNALTGWIVSLEVANPSLVPLLRANHSFEAGHYLAIQRAEYANVYWTVIDLLDIFITTQRMRIEPEKLNIILMDAHPATPLDPFWSVLFQRLIKLGVDRTFTESENVVFENLIWRYPRVNCPLLDKNLKSLDHIQPFREFVIKRFGIPSKSTLRNCSQPHKLNVLVSFRRDYQSHPRNLHGTVDRKIANEEDVISEMKKNFSSQLNITSAQLDAFPLKRQLELVASADIFFGMHGSAHGYPIFMAPGGAVVEIFNFNSGNWHMEKISTLSGHSHITWTSTDPKAYNTKTRSTTIPAGIPTMLLKKAIFKICEEKN